MARCPEVNSSGGEPPFLPPSFPQSGTGFAPPISNFYSEISFIFAVNVLYLSCDCRTRLKKRRKRVSFWGSSAIAAYPRKGTITLLMTGQPNSCKNCSLSPQGDDNFIRKEDYGAAPNCSLSPQGDDNFPLDTLRLCPRIAAYPRKGTITRPCLAGSSHQTDYSLSPQGDDNFVLQYVSDFFDDYSLSPQGDNNLLMLIFFIMISYCSLSPQGDDNFPLDTLRLCPRIAAYPRKGTITRPCLAGSSHQTDYSLSPQGDDNRTAVWMSFTR